jgi:hypothetical protein
MPALTFEDIPQAGQTQNLSFEDIPMAEKAQENGLSLLEKGVGAGMSAARGFTFGTGPKIAAGIGAGIAKPILEGVELLGGPEAPELGELYSRGVDLYTEPQRQFQQEMPITSTVAEIAGGITSGVGLARTAAAKALGTLARRGGVIGRISAGALGGESAQRVYEAGQAPIGEEAEILGREGISLGGILGGAVPTAGAVGRAVLPKVDDAIAPVVALAKKHNIPLSVDQLTSSRAIKNAQKVSQELPFSGQAGFRDKQMRALNRALLKTVGIKGDKFSRPVIEKTYLEAGKRFDKLTKGKTFDLGNEALDRLSEIEEFVKAGNFGDIGERAFKRHSDEIFTRLKGNVLEGDDMVALRNKFSLLSRTGSNVDAKELASTMEGFLADIISDGAPQALREAKHKYKNLIVLEPLMAKIKGGNISPARLTDRVNKIYGRQFIKGKAGDIGELADVSRELLPELGGSDTTQKLLFAGSALGGVIQPSTFLITGGAAAINRAVQSGVNRNQAIINSMTKQARKEFLALPPAEANKILDGISINLGLISGIGQ